MTISLPPAKKAERQRTARPSSNVPAAATAGLATLLFCLILLSSATTLIFTMARTSLAEQRIMGNEYHAESLRQAGEAGLHYAFAWIGQHELVWQLNDSGQYQLDIPLPADKLGLSHDIDLHIQAIRHDSHSAFFLLQAQASQTTANTTSRHRSRQFIHYSLITAAKRTSDRMADVITIPGTWHDF